MKRNIILIVAILLLTSPLWAATYTVTNCADSGPGSLRYAISSLEAYDVIEFDIPATEPASTGEVYRGKVTEGSNTWYRIVPKFTVLPPITAEGAQIKGSTQTINQGDTNSQGPEIEIRAYSISVVLNTGNNSGTTIEGLVINCAGAGSNIGINIQNASSVEVSGCYIGTTATGEATPSVPLLNGIQTNALSNSIIGGSGKGNLISGNSSCGIYMSNGSNNIFAGNIFGLDKDGDSAIPNNQGFFIVNSSNNTIGGTDAAERNIISGNTSSGLTIANGTSIEVYGNYFGTNSSGNLALGNSANGISLNSNSKYNIIGDGTIGGRNVISGNNEYGIYITDSNNNSIVGNWIGLATDESIATNESGIIVTGNSQSNNIISNVISGNTYGIIITGEGTASNEVLDNYIGTDANGTAARGNTQYGIYLDSGAQLNKIGNGTAGGRNVISGNTLNGVLIFGSGTNSNEVQGNFIGVQADGTSPLANGSGGILIDSSPQYNRIGSSETSGQRNIIAGHSGAGEYGIGINGASDNYVEGNWIGLATDESVATNESGIIVTGNSQSNNIIANVISGNSQYGIYIDGSLSNKIFGNTIGYRSDGQTLAVNQVYGILLTGNSTANNIIGSSESGRGNLIVSDNNGADAGISITNGAHHNYLHNNIIGLTSLEALPSTPGTTGLEISNNANYNFIGGSGANEGNVLSGNSVCGIQMSSANSNEVLGNLIGTDSSGNNDLANATNGIYIFNGSQFNKIGSGSPSGRNVISGNGGRGIWFSGSGTNSNEVKGNYIGTTSSGEAALPNQDYGVVISNGASYNIVGGNTSNPGSGDGNLISGNTSRGIYFHWTDTIENSILGNCIGTNPNGTSAIPNGSGDTYDAGIYIQYSPKNHIGNGTTNGRNIISGNDRFGIAIRSTGANSNEVLGNYIGTDSNGTANLGNTNHGIYLGDGALITRIGPSNTIAFNQDGIRIDGSNTTHEVITQNSIFSNSGKGIELINGGNGEVAPPQIDSADHNEVTGSTLVSGFASAEPSGVVEIFKSDNGQGKTYLGSAEVDSSGAWTAEVTSLVSGDAVVATGTTANPETSEFSNTKEVITTVLKGYQPDNSIATLDSYADITGEGIVNTDGTDQTRTMTITTGASAIYYIKIENNANTTDEVIVKGISGSGDWALTYYDAKTGGNNITSSIIGSGWPTGVMASTESKEIRMVAANSGSAVSTLEAPVTSESKTQTAMKDAVKASTTALPPPTDLSSFYVNAPSSAIQESSFSATLTALNSLGSVETNVIGTTQLLADSGTITPESIAESSFTNGVWTGNVSLSKIGARTITVSNEGSIGTAQVIVLNATIELTATDLGIAGMSITIPAGAASAEVSITANEVASPGDARAGYSIGGIIVDINSAVTEFLLPVTVTLPINGPLADPRVFYWTGTKWSNDGISVISYTDAEITFTTTHFTIFAPMAAASTNLVRFGPNPYDPSSGANAKIWYWLAADAQTSIYIVDMRGKLIWKNSYAVGVNGGQTGANNIDFDGKDRWGNALGDGVYLYKVVEGGKSIGGGKIAIIK